MYLVNKVVRTGMITNTMNEKESHNPHSERNYWLIKVH